VRTCIGCGKANRQRDPTSESKSEQARPHKGRTASDLHPAPPEIKRKHMPERKVGMFRSSPLIHLLSFISSPSTAPIDGNTDMEMIDNISTGELVNWSTDELIDWWTDELVGEEIRLSGMRQKKWRELTKFLQAVFMERQERTRSLKGAEETLLGSNQAIIRACLDCEASVDVQKD
jgi:hypothetical protein